MKITYLGTAAYEGVPAMFCNCRVCKLSKKLGGKNLRSRSQALINDDLLIDFNADTVWHYQRYGFDWEKIDGVLITHSHSDHLYPADMEMPKRSLTHEHRTVNFYSAKSGYKKMRVYKKFMTDGEMTVNLITPGKRFTLGKYSVLPLWASHDKYSTPVIYSISRENKKMLYAHDTGLFGDRTWEGLKSEKYFNLISLDCTGCLGHGGSDYSDHHMSMKAVRVILQRMRSEKLIDENTRIVVNHFSHNGGQTYDEMVEGTKDDGVIVSYDGMSVEF